MAGKKEYLYGKHALVEALVGAPHTLGKVFLAQSVRDAELLGLLSAHHITPHALGAGAAREAAGERGSHQGVIAEFYPGALTATFDTFLTSLNPSEKPTLVILDHLTDPNNFGAIIRSAAAFGAAGIVMPAVGGAPISGAVIKASAGMAFRVPLITADDLSRAVATLKEIGFLAYALDMHGTPLHEARFGTPCMFIIGNEGEGVSESLRGLCDTALSIPMDPRCESLNAAVAASVVLYARSIQQGL